MHPQEIRREATSIAIGCADAVHAPVEAVIRLAELVGILATQVDDLERRCGQASLQDDVIAPIRAPNLNDRLPHPELPL
jgi:hypothetical protein